MKPAWARAVRDECESLDIAFFMKQIGVNHEGWPTNISGKGTIWTNGRKVSGYGSFRLGIGLISRKRTEPPIAIWSSPQMMPPAGENRRVFLCERRRH